MRAPASAGRCGSRRATQSAGRGRRGSAWVSRRAISYATLLLTEPSPPELAPQLSFVAALALHDAIAECAPQLGPTAEAEMAERSAARAGQACRHPDRRRERAGLRRRDRHRRQLRRASGRHALSGDRSCRAAAPGRRRTQLLRALVARHAAASGAMEARARLCEPSAPTGSSAPRAWARHSRASAGAGTGRPVSRVSTMPAACCLPGADGVTTVTAGEVFGLGRALTWLRPQQELVFAPLGGVGEIGMNLSIYGLGDERRADGSPSISACRSRPRSICRASI